MFDADTRIIPQNQYDAARPVVDLSFSLDALDASEEYWRELPDPYPLFIEEARRGLGDAVGGLHENQQ
jgi:hypothetical protein